MQDNLTIAVKKSLQGLLGTALINRIAPVIAQRLIQMGIEVPPVMLQCGNGEYMFISEEADVIFEGEIK